MQCFDIDNTIGLHLICRKRPESRQARGLALWLTCFTPSHPRWCTGLVTCYCRDKKHLRLMAASKIFDVVLIIAFQRILLCQNNGHDDAPSHTLHFHSAQVTGALVKTSQFRNRFLLGQTHVSMRTTELFLRSVTHLMSTRLNVAIQRHTINWPPFSFSPFCSNHSAHTTDDLP